MTKIQQDWPEHWITDKGDHIVIVGDAFNNIFWSGSDDDLRKSWGHEDMTDEQVEEFLSLFTIEPKTYVGNPEEDYYQGMEFTKLIRRLADDRRFGFTYWKPVAKYDEFDVEHNGTDWGYEFPVPDHTDEYFWNHEYMSSGVFSAAWPFAVEGYYTRKPE